MNRISKKKRKGRVGRQYGREFFMESSVGREEKKNGQGSEKERISSTNSYVVGE